MLVVILAASLALQNPPPSGGVASQNQQNHSREAAQAADTNQRGTEQSPIVIKQLPTPKTKEELDQEAQDRQERTATDGKIVYFTGWLVAATIALAVIGFLQVVVFFWQGIQLKRTVAAGQESAKAFMAGERAWIAATLDLVQGKRYLHETSENGVEAVSGSFRLSHQNVGKTPAWVTNIRACLQVVTVLPEPPQLSALEMVEHLDETLATGQGGTASDFGLRTEINLPPTGHHRMTIVWGVIEYRDIFEKTRRTYFGYAVNPDRTSFRRLISRAYNRHE
jgi:hypothetical protein